MTSSTATLRPSATTPCWCSCWIAAMPPAPMISRCSSTCTTIKKSQLTKTLEEFENTCRPYGCQKVVLTSGENGYGIPELQAILNKAIEAEFADEDAE